MSGNSNQKSILNYFRQKSVRKTEYATPSTLSQDISTKNVDDNDKRDSKEFKTSTPKVDKVRKRIHRIASSSESDLDDVIEIPPKKFKCDDTDTSGYSPLKAINDQNKSVQERSVTPTTLIGQRASFGTTKLNRSSTKTSKDSKNINKTSEENNEIFCVEKKFTHELLDFLQPDKILDKFQRRPDDEDYDPRTLYVPKSFINKATPAMKQWWTMKIDYFDCIFLFKVGKFYECYHMDAVKAVQILGICYSRGEYAKAGFPEQVYPKMSETLVNHGLKVARIEQTETPQMKEKRLNESKGNLSFNRSTNESGKSAANIITRELCQISNKGVKIQNFLSSDNFACFSNYMIAIKEVIIDDKPSFGICIVDTNLSEFYFASFLDDAFRTNLLTTFSHYKPSLFLLERLGLSKTTKKILTEVFNVNQEWLVSGKEFYNAKITEQELRNEKYFKIVPNFFTELSGSNTMCSYNMMLNAFGACIYFLKYCLIDVQVLSGAKFFTFDLNMSKNVSQKYMIIDNSTVEGLSLFGERSTLQYKIDHCITPFGKRLLKSWLCKPFMNVDQIQKFHVAAKELLQFSDNHSNTYFCWINKIFKKFVDFDRMKQRVTTHLFRRKNYDHPDNRAVFFEEKLFNKNQIKSLVQILNGLNVAYSFAKQFSEHKYDSSLLTKFRLEPHGTFPDVEAELKYFQKAFNFEEAIKRGSILPNENHVQYMEHLNEKSKIEKEIDQALDKFRKEYSPQVTLHRNDKGFLIYFPIKLNRHKLPNDFINRGLTKTTAKFSCATFDALFAKYGEYERQLKVFVHDYEKVIIEQFVSNIPKWDKIVEILSIFDVLFSFVNFNRVHSDFVCSPSITNSDYNYLKLIGSLPPSCDDFNNFQQNNIEMGLDDNSKRQPSFFLICGPNMSGKSTILRQAGLNVILSQIGSFVAAKQCELTPVDRIFTRVGARDDIVGGDSTFSVELNEMKTIIESSTKSSLLLIDEFGNGTSSHDGAALAIACINYLKRKGCRTFFSTHFKQVLNFFQKDSSVLTKRMSYIVDKKDHSEEIAEKIVFLYNLENGGVIKSYAFNVASMVGLDDDTINFGFRKANEIEQNRDNYRTLQKIFNS